MGKIVVYRVILLKLFHLHYIYSFATFEQITFEFLYFLARHIIKSTCKPKSQMIE